MDPNVIKDLSYITKIDNISSILKCGILCHSKADKVDHVSVANGTILAKRKDKKIPQGLALFDYVNLYFNARNPMMSRLFYKGVDVESICVLGIDPCVMKIKGVVITDGNAASEYVRFRPYPEGVEVLNEGYLFARSWKHEGDPIEEMRHRTYMCAEVLVPHRVDKSFIMGAIVCSDTAKA